MEKRTPKTVIELRALVEHLKKVHAQGYSIDDEEYEEGVRCIGAPVRDYTGNVVAAVSISGPAMRMTEKKIVEDLVQAVREAGEEISRRLGYDISQELTT